MAGVVVFLAIACSDSQDRSDPPAGESSAQAGVFADEPLEAFRGELLDLAFEAASALPVDPHIKNRSRAQDAVVAACLELGQPSRALGYIEKIDNWRRGSGYADLAFYCARRGFTDKVRHYLDLARRIAEESAREPNAQAWRSDRIKVKIARTHALLGQDADAARFEAGVVDSEKGKVNAVRAARLDADFFESEIEWIGSVVSKGNFENTGNALHVCAELFNRFYDDDERRTLAEETIKSSWSKLPSLIRVELTMKLARFALDHEDRAKALALVEEAFQLIDSSNWSAEHSVPALARLAEIRFRAGEEAAARNDAKRALALFDRDRSKIINIYQAGALRPLAVLYQAMGDRPAALEIYSKALEAGVENPNSRPRAEDLSATCSSMAVHGVEPDAALKTRMLKIFNELGHPW